MILESFWKGDLEAMRPHVDDHVFDAFAGAVEQRANDGLVLDNRLVAIEHAVIAGAEVERKIALVTVRFEADIAAVTRNADGRSRRRLAVRRGPDARPLDLPPRRRRATIPTGCSIETDEDE